MNPPRPTVVSMAAPAQDPEGRFVLGSYTKDGEVFVFADSLDLAMLHNHQVKDACYKHRLAVGMGTAGIELPLGPYPLDKEEAKHVPALVTSADDKQVYRIAFKLNAGI